MCCRYYMEDSPELKPFVDQALKSPIMRSFQETLGAGLVRSGEVSPSMIAPVIASNRRMEKTVFPMQWGFPWPGHPLIINARVETAGQKPLFRDAWNGHRCIIPASYYFEWEHKTRYDGRKDKGEKYLLQTKESSLTWLCGLYRIDDGIPRFIILTREPGEEICFIHDRMPLIIEEKDIDTWIHPDTNPREIFQRSITDLYYEKTG